MLRSEFIRQGLRSLQLLLDSGATRDATRDACHLLEEIRRCRPSSRAFALRTPEGELIAFPPHIWLPVQSLGGLHSTEEHGRPLTRLDYLTFTELYFQHLPSLHPHIQYWSEGKIQRSPEIAATILKELSPLPPFWIFPEGNLNQIAYQLLTKRRLAPRAASEILLPIPKEYRGDLALAALDHIAISIPHFIDSPFEFHPL